MSKPDISAVYVEEWGGWIGNCGGWGQGPYPSEADALASAQERADSQNSEEGQYWQEQGRAYSAGQPNDFDGDGPGRYPM